MYRILYLYTHNNCHVTVLCSHSQWVYGQPTCIVHHRRRRQSAAKIFGSAAKIFGEQPPLASEVCLIYHLVYPLRPPHLFAAALQGYLQRCRQHLALFPEERTDKLFANVEHLVMFQKAFLEDIESQISRGAAWNAQIGQCFLRHVSASYPHHHCS